MDTWQIVLGWGSPIGIGTFLLCIGCMVYLLSKAGKAEK
jgi:hypothetical protein